LILNIEPLEDKVQVSITYDGITVPSDAELALSSGVIPDRKHLGLEIFTEKILMTYYGGRIESRKDNKTGDVSFVLDFKQFRR